MNSLSFGKDYIEWEGVGRREFWSWMCLLAGEWPRLVQESRLCILLLGLEPAWKQSRHHSVLSPQKKDTDFILCKWSLLYCCLFKFYLSENLQIMKLRKKKIINQKQNHQLHNPNMQTKNRSYKIIGFLYDLVPVIQVEIGTPCSMESGVCFESLVSHVQISMILGYSVYLEKPW